MIIWWCKIKTGYFLYESVIEVELSEMLVRFIYEGVKYVCRK
jgi:hypothetical protein